MDIRFVVDLEKKDIFKYNIHHTYTGFSGWFSIILAVFIVTVAVLTRDRIGSTYMIVYIVLALAFLLSYPVQFLIKANTLFAVPGSGFNVTFHYTVDDAGITAKTDDAEETASWDMIYKAVKTKEAFYLYTSRVNAYIFPLRCIGEQEEVLTEVFRDKLPDYRRNFK